MSKKILQRISTGPIIYGRKTAGSHMDELTGGEVIDILSAQVIQQTILQTSATPLRANVHNITTVGTEIYFDVPYENDSYIIIPVRCMAASGMNLSVEITGKFYNRFIIKSLDENGTLYWVCVHY